EDLREAIELEQRGGVELRAADRLDRIRKTVPEESQGECAVLDRPDRAAVVAERVVSGILRRQRPDSPAGEKIRGKKPARDRRHERLVQDSCRETVAGIGSDGADGSFVRAQSQSDEPLLLHPEGLVETLLELSGLREESARVLFPVQPPQDLGEMQLRCIEK